jgi:hypothetical protein
MAADLETRAMRMITGQTGLLRLRMAMSQPDYEAQPDGMLFKRTVEVPPDADLETVLAKWNPGVPPETVTDLIGSVCRWNQLKNAQSVRPGQKLLIPTVLPHGREPEKRPMPFAAGTRPAALAAAPPMVSPQLAMRSHYAEQRLRQAAEQQPADRPKGTWVTQGQASSLAATNVKQQLNASVWQHGAGQRVPTNLRA